MSTLESRRLETRNVVKLFVYPFVYLFFFLAIIFSGISLQKAETDDKNEVSPADMANSHMVEGYYQLADLVDEQKIATLDGKSSIRFNEFYNPHKAGSFLLDSTSMDDERGWMMNG